MMKTLGLIVSLLSGIGLLILGVHTFLTEEDVFQGTVLFALGMILVRVVDALDAIAKMSPQQD
jgi:hypothetical protein